MDLITQQELDHYCSRLKKDSSLIEIDLHGKNIDDEAAKKLAKALEANTTLQTIHLWNNGIGDTGAASLAKVLKTKTALQELDLYNNDIGSEGAISLAKALETNSSLKKLNLDSNNIGDDGAFSLANALEFNTTLQELALGCNDIGDEGAKKLLEALQNYNGTLTLLKVDNNNVSSSITREKIVSLATQNKEGTRSPRPLHRPWPYGHTTKKKEKTGGRSEKGVRRLGRLGKKLFQRNDRSNDQGQEKITLLIEQSNAGAGISSQPPPARTDEDGGSGKKYEEELDRCCMLLQQNTLTTNQVDLSYMKVGDDQVKKLAGALKMNVTLQTLLLDGNNIGDAGATSLAEALETNTTLQELSLVGNTIGDDGAAALLEAVQNHNGTLKSLNLGRNNVLSSYKKDQMYSLLEQNKNGTRSPQPTPRPTVTDQSVEIAHAAEEIALGQDSMEHRHQQAEQEWRRMVKGREEVQKREEQELKPILGKEREARLRPELEGKRLVLIPEDTTREEIDTVVNDKESVPRSASVPMNVDEIEYQELRPLLEKEREAERRRRRKQQLLEKKPEEARLGPKQEEKRLEMIQEEVITQEKVDPVVNDTESPVAQLAALLGDFGDMNASVAAMKDIVELLGDDLCQFKALVTDLKQFAFATAVKGYEMELLSVLEGQRTSNEDAQERLAIQNSNADYDFYLHFQWKLCSMIRATECIASGMVKRDISFQNQMISLISSEGFVDALESISFVKSLSRAIRIAMRQFESIPGMHAARAAVELIMEFGHERKQNMAVARVALFSTLVQIRDGSNGGIGWMVERAACLLVRCNARCCDLYCESGGKWDRVKGVLLTSLGDIASSSSGQMASKAAAELYRIVMKPPEGSVFKNVCENVASEIPLHVALVATFLDLSVDDVTSLDRFSVAVHPLGKSSKVSGGKGQSLSPMTSSNEIDGIVSKHDIAKLAVELQSVKRTQKEHGAKLSRIPNDANDVDGIEVDAGGGMKQMMIRRPDDEGQAATLRDEEVLQTLQRLGIMDRLGMTEKAVHETIERVDRAERYLQENSAGTYSPPPTLSSFQETIRHSDKQGAERKELFQRHVNSSGETC